MRIYITGSNCTTGTERSLEKEYTHTSTELEFIVVSIALTFIALVLLIVFIWKDPREKAIQALKDAGATSRETAVNISEIPILKIREFILKELMDAEMHGRNAFVLRDLGTGMIYLDPGVLSFPKVNLKIVGSLSAVPATLLLLALLAGLTGFRF